MLSLYKCNEYLDNYFNHYLKIKNLYETELIIIHNDPSYKEIAIINKYLSEIPHYQYLKVDRESVYKSWNRGIKVANGKYITIWNVDDIRFPNSLKIQSEVLDKNPNVGLVYGNRYESNKYGSNNKIKINTIDINKSPWYKKFQGGCFYMWRKHVHNNIGYFDEQFISSGDQDFWYRVLKCYEVVRVNKTLGIFTKEPGMGISTISKMTGIEKIVVGLRYGFFTYIKLFGWREAFKKYDINRIHYYNNIKRVKILRYSHLMVYIYSFRTIVLSIFK